MCNVWQKSIKTISLSLKLHNLLTGSDNEFQFPTTTYLQNNSECANSNQMWLYEFFTPSALFFVKQHSLRSQINEPTWSKILDFFPTLLALFPPYSKFPIPLVYLGLLVYEIWLKISTLFFYFGLFLKFFGLQGTHMHVLKPFTSKLGTLTHTWLAFFYFLTNLVALFPPYSISKFSTLLIYLVKFAQNIHPTRLIGTWEYYNFVFSNSKSSFSKK